MGQIIKATFHGEEQEFEVLVSGKHGTHRINGGGIFENSGSSWYEVPLRLIRKRHTFGGVVFEETGEVRPPGPDEWYLVNNGNGVMHTADGKYAHLDIVRHVCEGQE